MNPSKLIAEEERIEQKIRLAPTMCAECKSQTGPFSMSTLLGDRKMKLRKKDFVKVTKGEHKGKRGTIITNKRGIITIRTYPHMNYLKINPCNAVRCSLTGIEF